MTVITASTKRQYRTPAVVKSHRNLWGFVPFFVWHVGYLGPALILAGIFAPTVANTDRPGIIAIGAIMTIGFGPLVVRAIVLHVKARIDLAKYASEHAPTMTPAEVRYFARHAKLSDVGSYSFPKYVLSAPADHRKLVIYSLVAE